MTTSLTIAEISFASEDVFTILSNLHHRAFTPQDDAPWSAGDFRDIVASPGARVFIARQEDQPVGFALIRTVCDEAEIISLAVDPSTRQQGVGRALLDHFVASLRAQGVEKIFLEVREDNRAAIRLYENAGFEVVGKRPGYYQTLSGNRKDALCLVLILTK